MTSPRSLLIGVTAASLLALPGAVSTATAAQPAGTAAADSAVAARQVTRIVFLDFDHTRPHDGTTVVRGQLTNRSRSGSFTGEPVTLYRKFAGTSQWRRLGRAGTGQGARPSFSFSVKSRANAAYKVVYRGDARRRPSSGTTTVSVFRRFHARLRDGSGRFRGRVTPQYAHKPVHLERLGCGTCGWKRSQTSRTGNRGEWSFRVGAPRRGRVLWRVSTPASAKFIQSYSAVFSTRRR